VNLLGIGLHTYGFTAGIYNALVIFYVLEGVVLLAAFISRLVSNRNPAANSQ